MTNEKETTEYQRNKVSQKKKSTRRSKSAASSGEQQNESQTAYDHIMEMERAQRRIDRGSHQAHSRGQRRTQKGVAGREKALSS
jgi:hypothetical protein